MNNCTQYKSCIIITLSLGFFGSGCFGPRTVDDIINSPEVQQALNDFKAQNPTSGCIFGHLPIEATPPNVEGTWVFDEATCQVTNSSDGNGLGPCAGSLTYFNQKGDRVEQANQGAISQGNGAGFVIGFESTTTSGEPFSQANVYQTNTATGESCTQDIINIVSIQGDFNSSESIGFCVMTVILDSTCPASDWQAGTGLISR